MVCRPFQILMAPQIVPGKVGNPVRGLLDSPLFDITVDYFREYPATSDIDRRARALLYLLVRICKPERVLELDTDRAGNTEVLARAIVANALGRLDTVSCGKQEAITAAVAEWDIRLQWCTSRIEQDFQSFIAAAQRSGLKYEIVLMNRVSPNRDAGAEISSLSQLVQPDGFLLVNHCDQADTRAAVERVLRDRKAWRLLETTRSGFADHKTLNQRSTSSLSVPGSSLWILRAPARCQSWRGWVRQWIERRPARPQSQNLPRPEAWTVMSGDRQILDEIHAIAPNARSESQQVAVDAELDRLLVRAAGHSAPK